MVTSKYLDSVLKVMPAIQARQIADLLNKLSVAGEIRNADEYAAKLQELSTLINDQNPIPSFNQISAGMWFVCESAAHNAMMEALKNDLEALFLQIDEIGTKVNDHHFLVMKNLAADLERGLADQENKILKFEWLAGQDNEFSLVLVNSFVSASLLNVSRSDALTSGLYFDNRTFAAKTKEELPDAVVDEYGEKLILETSNDPVTYPVSVRQLNDEYSYGTEEAVDIGNNIDNIIDGTRGTYWTRNVYLSERVHKVTTILEFDLGRAKDINYIAIEGAAGEAFIVESIKGVSTDGSTIDLISSEVEVSGNTRIDFDRMFAKAFQITFSVYSYTKAEYFIPEEYSLNDFIEPMSAYRGSSIVKVIPSSKRIDRVQLAKDIGPTVRKVLNSDNLSDLLNIPKAVPKQISSYAYNFALDNVWAGNSKYIDSGIFVSKQLVAEDAGILAINASENMGDAVGEVYNTAEYQIIKRDNHPFFKEVTFPIPSLDQTHATSERLILTKKEDKSDNPDTGQLRFCPYVSPDWVLGDANPITVYENGKVLIFSQDYEYAIKTITSSLGQAKLDWEGNDWTTAISLSNYKLATPKMWIKILRPSSNAVYTVDYEIRTSDTYMVDEDLWLDTDKTISLSHGGRVNFRRENLDVIIKSDIYLQITLRRNIATQSKSPELLEYAVLCATYTK